MLCYPVTIQCFFLYFLSTIKIIFRKFLSNFTFRARCLTVLVPLMINIKHVWLLFVISMFMPNLSKLGTVSYLIYHLLVESLFFKLATSMAIITPLCNKIKHGMAQLCFQYAFFALLFRAECITRWFLNNYIFTLLLSIWQYFHFMFEMFEYSDPWIEAEFRVTFHVQQYGTRQTVFR
jgi:hypothetical protein